MTYTVSQLAEALSEIYEPAGRNHHLFVLHCAAHDRLSDMKACTVPAKTYQDGIQAAFDICRELNDLSPRIGNVPDSPRMAMQFAIEQIQQILLNLMDAEVNTGRD